MIILLSVFAIACRKPVDPVAGQAQAVTGAAQPATAPAASDTAIASLLANLRKAAYQPTAEDLETYGVKANCARIDFSRLKIGPVTGNRVIVQPEYVRKLPGVINCVEDHFLLNYEQNKWVLSPLTGRKVLTDINGDGLTDVLVFRQTYSDGPERVIEKVLLGNAEGKLTEKADPALAQCGSMSDGPLPTVRASGCDLELDCEDIVDDKGHGSGPGTMRYDGQKQAFVIKPNQPK